MNINFVIGIVSGVFVLLFLSHIYDAGKQKGIEMQIDRVKIETGIAETIKEIVCKHCANCSPEHVDRCHAEYHQEAAAIYDWLEKNNYLRKEGQ